MKPLIRMIIVSLIGLKKCGKTTTAEALIREFKRRGYRVGGVKYMPHSTFTIDIKGKDTWRQKEAGADFVISLSKDEIAYMEPRNTGIDQRPALKDLVRLVPAGTDILICEGLTEDDPGVLRVVLARSAELMQETFETRGLSEKRGSEGDAQSEDADGNRPGWSIEDGTKVEGDEARVIAFSGIMAGEVERVPGFPDLPVFNCSIPEGAKGLADLILTFRN